MRGGLLIWIFVLGIASVLFLRIVSPRKAVMSGSPVSGFSKAVENAPDSANSSSTPPVESPSDPLPAADAPVTNAEAASPAEDDPGALAEKISLMSETEVRARLAQLAGEDLAGNTARLLLRRWVELDPTAAVGWLTQLTDAGARRELTDVLGVAWSQKDLPAALAWVESLPEDDAKRHALTDIGYEVARTDPLNAMQIAAQLPADENSDALLLHALAQYASADPGQSQQLALSLPPGQMRDRVLSTMATVQAKQDGAQAARFAVENISPGPELDRAIIGIVQIWGKGNPTEASAWVQSLPDSPVRTQAIQILNAF